METSDNNSQENAGEKSQTDAQTLAPTDPPPTPTGSSNDEGGANYAQERAPPAVTIKPTPGRVVWFWREKPQRDDEQPEAAFVVYVHNDEEVSLVVFDRFGSPRPELHVPLVDDIGDNTRRFAQWMRYQANQARLQVSGTKPTDS